MAIRRDAQRGVVQVFGGVLGRPDPSDLAQAALIRSGQLGAEIGQPQSVDVLPISGRVWRVNGRPVPLWVTAHAASVAMPPPFASMAAEWLTVEEQTPDGVTSTGQRDLSVPEQMELKRHRRLLWLRPLPLAIVFSGWLLWPLVAALRAGHSPHLSDWSGALILNAWALFAVTRQTIGVVQARGLGRDLKVGFVRIVRATLPDGEEYTLEEQPQPLEVEGGALPLSHDHLFEFLPMSRRLWTKDGTPADWRRKP